MADFKDITKALEKAIDIGTSGATQRKVGKFLVKQIRTRTRVGKGVDRTIGKQVKLKIKDQTKARRRKLKKQGKLSGMTTPAKANLTRSGQMLASLRHSVNRATSTVTVAVSEKEQRKVNELAKQGHKFLDLTKGEFREVIEIVVSEIIRGLRKFTKSL